MTYALTQAFTGHCFRDYLWRKKKAPDPSCPYCHHPAYTASHTFFECIEWNDARSQLKGLMSGRGVSESDVQDLLCGPDPVSLPEENTRSSRWWKQ